MIGYNVNAGAGPFEVVSPTFEGVVDGHKFFIVHVVISFSVFESLGVECNRVVVAVWGSDGVTRHAGVDRARSSGRSGSEFGRTWLQQAGHCADSSFVSGI